MICSVTLTVLRPDSEPLAGITVSAFIRGTGTPIDAVTDASGEAQFSIQSGSVVRFVCSESAELNGNTVEIPNTSNFNVGTFTADAASEGDPGGSSLDKATGAEVDTGTDDAKYITPKALEDSDYIKEADLPPSGGASNFYAGVDFAGFVDNLPAHTYNNGASGVGATITADSNGALDIYGDNPVNGQSVALIGVSTGTENGFYDVTEAGDGSTPFVLTRRSDLNTSSQVVKGAGVTVADSNGRFANCMLYVSTASNPVIGTDDINFLSMRGDRQIESIVAGSGISVDDTDPANPVISLGAVPSGLFADLPGSPTIGNLFVVTDCPNNAWGDIVNVGGDTQTALIWYNGTEWRVIGGVPII